MSTVPRSPGALDASLLALAGLLQPLPLLAALRLAAPDALTPGSVALSFALGTLGCPLGFAAAWWLTRRSGA